MRNVFCKLRLVLTLSVLPMLLSGCGSDADNKQKVTLFGTVEIVMLFITLFVATTTIISLIHSQISVRRGTNSVSRFLRHNSTYRTQKKAAKRNALVLAGDAVGLIIGFNIVRLITTLIPICIIVYSIYLMNKGTDSKERVEATRDLTKAGVTAGKGAAVVGTAVGGVVAAPVVVGAAGVTGVAGAAVGLTTMGSTWLAGHEIAKGAERVHAHMEDVDHGRDVREFPELSDGSVISPDEFIKKAVRLGCDTTMSVRDMATTVIGYAPEASLRELPEDMDDIEKAARLLGAVHSPAIEENKNDNVVIDADFKEVKEVQ